MLAVAVSAGLSYGTEVLQQFMQLHQGKLSHPLFMCLTLLIDYLADEPAHFAALVERSAQYVRR